MILERLILTNFRQFLGRQEIIFATGKKKNVTLVHGENGFGKTALLNALLWGFYGYDGLTDDFEHKATLINEGLAASGGDPNDLEVSVTIQFTDDRDQYTLTRSQTLAKQQANPKDTKLNLDVKRADGQSFSDLKRDQLQLESLMPRGISRYLFFNGERIDHLAMAKNASEITDAIYQMLGLKLLETTIEDLGHQNVRGRLNKELKDYTDESTSELLGQEEELEEKIQALKMRREACCEEQEAVASEIKKIGAKLEADKATRALQQERERLETEESGLEQRSVTFTTRLGETIADSGFTLFAQELAARGREISTQLRREGKIPARVVNSFVEELLNAHRCICGCELVEGTDAYEKVKELLEIAGDQQFNHAVSALDHAIGVIEGQAQKTRNLLEDLTKERLEVTKASEEVREQLAEIHAKLSSRDDEAVVDLENKRQELQLKQRELDQNEGALRRDLEDYGGELESVVRQIKASKQQAKEAKLAKRRVSALHDAKDLLQTILDQELEDLRAILNEEIDSHFRKIIDRAYWAELSKDYVLKIRKRLDPSGSTSPIDVAQSTGQRQLTSLVFIASLVALARRRAEIPTILRGLDGGEYPMVMDSPFGQLGDEFRSGVAKWIPSLAPQVILFVSSSQYHGAVDEQLETAGRVGRRYLLRYFGSNHGKSDHRRIRIQGKLHPQYQQDDSERTELVELDS